MCAERETQFVRQHEISLSDPPNYLHPAKTLVSQLLSILILPVEAERTAPINNSRFNYGGITPHIEKLPVLCLIPLIQPYLFTGFRIGLSEKADAFISEISFFSEHNSLRRATPTQDPNYVRKIARILFRNNKSPAPP